MNPQELLKGGVPIMKARGRKKNILKNISTLVIVFVLICCSFSALTVTTIATSQKNSNLDTPSYNSGESQESSLGNVILLDENFTDGNMPPTGVNGNWELQQTNPDQTWYIDSTSPHTKPYCGTIHRNQSQDLQDEWLISPSLNFGASDKINMTFSWYTCFYVTVWKHYIEFNISVSTDGGATWTNIWSFDDMDTSIPFTDWSWYNTNYPNNKPIDLSAFAHENDVRIAFQYSSNTTAAAPQQEFSIDDIFVWATGIGNLTCDAGGPYNWYWNMQNKYWPTPGVRFHGSVQNGTALTQLLWDFGDGNATLFPYINYNPIHFYNEIGTFNVTLTAKDTSHTPPWVAISSTTVTLFLTEPPAIDINLQNISLGIKANIINDGQYNATYVNWTINISWGPFQIFKNFDKTVGNGTVENIAAGKTATIRSPLYFFAYGRISIELRAYPENLQGVTRTFNGIKIGPVVIIFPTT